MRREGTPRIYTAPLICAPASKSVCVAIHWEHDMVATKRPLSALESTGGSILNRTKAALDLALRKDVISRSVRVALVVGSVLILINYADKILARMMAPSDFVKVVLTYFVPYFVSTYASVSALLAPRDAPDG